MELNNEIRRIYQEYISSGYDKEMCGYIINNILHTAVKQHEKSKCYWITPYQQVIWHTHPLQSKYYPSYQDILKIIKHININQSYILTSQGFWILSYQGYINEWEQYIEKLQKYLNAFYGFTNGGRQRTEKAEKWLKYKIETLIPGYRMDFFSYDQLQQLYFSFETNL